MEIAQAISWAESASHTHLGEGDSIINSVEHGFKDDKTVPPGWKIGHGKGILIILSPAKERYISRLDALKHHIKCEAPGKEIWILRSYLQFEGWMENEHLPQGWLYRIMDSGELCFLSPKVDQFGSIEEVKKDIEQDEYYAGYDEENLRFLDEKGSGIDKSAEAEENDEYSQMEIDGDVDYLDEEAVDRLISLEEALDEKIIREGDIVGETVQSDG